MRGLQSPSQQFGDLFVAVQQAHLFEDSKTFADAVPRRPVDDILLDWRKAGALAGKSLRQFVEVNFTLPQRGWDAPPQGLSLAEHIDTLWDMLTRSQRDQEPRGSDIRLPCPYVIPGGRFRELYYWDSYFTMLGLALAGRQQLVESMITNFGNLIDRFGFIPNGTRSYYLSRSQPPFFYLMAGLSQDMSEKARRQRLVWMRREYGFWMSGAEGIAPGGEHRRVVRLCDGTLLNRYWDDVAAPRDESWREDVALAEEAEQPAASLWRNLRAAAESGWDFSSRWMGDATTLASIRTTRILPVDLNCLLHGLERTIAEYAAALGQRDIETQFRECAQRRSDAIERVMWNEALGCHADFDLDAGDVSHALTAAAAFPLYADVTTADRAARISTALEALLKPGGLATTPKTSGEQWDAPNGWAPLQWVAVAGLRRYGNDALATKIARHWLATVQGQFDRCGQLFEKYDVERRDVGGGGEYATETGFGWTNGVVLALADYIREVSVDEEIPRHDCP